MTVVLGVFVIDRLRLRCRQRRGACPFHRDQQIMEHTFPL
jgi:hypothetical protein